jgi:hypothetical protein
VHKLLTDQDRYNASYWGCNDISKPQTVCIKLKLSNA